MNGCLNWTAVYVPALFVFPLPHWISTSPRSRVPSPFSWSHFKDLVKSVNLLLQLCYAAREFGHTPVDCLEPFFVFRVYVTEI